MKVLNFNALYAFVGCVVEMVIVEEVSMAAIPAGDTNWFRRHRHPQGHAGTMSGSTFSEIKPLVR